MARLNKLCKTTTFDFAIAVGALVIHGICGGSLDEWRRRGVKHTSFRKLSSHPNLPMSPGALYRSVAIYELCERLGVKSWKHVSTSHLRLVLPLGPEDQARLLDAAEKDAWSVRHLDDEVAAILLRAPDVARGRGGRHRRSRIGHVLRDLSQCLEQLNALGEVDLSEADGSPEEVRSMVELLGDVSVSANRLMERLRPAP